MDITDISQVEDNLFEITIHVTGSQQIPLKYLYSLKVIGVNGPKGTVQLYGKNENTYLIDNPTDFTTTFEIYATLTDCQYWMSNFQIQFEYMQGDASQYWETWTWGTTTFDLGTGCTNYDNQGHSQTDFPGFYWTIGLPSECVPESNSVESIATSSSMVSVPVSSSDETSSLLAATTTQLSISTTEEYIGTTDLPPISFELDDILVDGIPTGWSSGWDDLTTSSVAMESSLDAEFRTRVTLASSSEITSSVIDHAASTNTYASVDHTTTLETVTSADPITAATSEVSNSKTTLIFSSSLPVSSTQVSLSSHSLDAIENSAATTPVTPIETSIQVTSNDPEFKPQSTSSSELNDSSALIESVTIATDSIVSSETASFANSSAIYDKPTSTLEADSKTSSTMFTYERPMGAPPRSPIVPVSVSEAMTTLVANSSSSVASLSHATSSESSTTDIITKNATIPVSSRSSLDARETTEPSSSTTGNNSFSSIPIVSTAIGLSLYDLPSAALPPVDAQTYSSEMPASSFMTSITSTSSMPIRTVTITSSSNAITSSVISSRSSLDARQTTVNNSTSGVTTNTVSIPNKEQKVSQSIVAFTTSELVNLSSATFSRNASSSDPVVSATILSSNVISDPSSFVASSNQWTSVSSSSGNMSTIHTTGNSINSSSSTLTQDIPTTIVTTSIATTKTQTITSCSNDRCHTSVVTTTIGTVVTNTVYSCNNTLSVSSSNKTCEDCTTQTTTSHISHGIPSTHITNSAESTPITTATPTTPITHRQTTESLSRSSSVASIDVNHSDSSTVSHITESGSTTTTLSSRITPEAFINTVSSVAPYNTHSTITRVYSSISSQSSEVPTAQTLTSSVPQVQNYQNSGDKLIFSVSWIISIICVLQVL
ncbi:hypothetical protein DAKH74_037490 [Maudiozyma humilis]|uniref:Flo11 domain-containing protein n=1 Tax=Maudiozyma humilis TaxID=51915 RepID=A0AAV5S2L5_MAUHU|nr:hypothetical protein DAKH74_037490 [Kazachstania humilis]